MNFTTNSASLQNICYVFADVYKVNGVFPSNVYLVSHIVSLVVNIIIATATVSLNAFTVFTFWKSSHLKNKVPFFLIMVQSVIDLGVGIFVSPLFTFFLVGEINGATSCWLHFTIKRVILLTTILSLSISSGMSFERYLGVVQPLLHRNKVTIKLLSKYVFIICLLCVIMFGISLVKKQGFGIFATVIVVLSVMVIAYSYIRIVWATVFDTFSGVTPLGNTSSNPSQQNVKRRQRLRQIKLAKSCSLVVVCIFACYLPAATLGRLININFFERAVFRAWTVILVMLNSCLNSVIFFWKNRILRHEAKMVLRSLHNSKIPS